MYNISNQKIKSIAHRGFMLKDNSIQAFNRAFGMGFDMIELDIQICKDDVVIYHDLTFNNKFVSELTYKEMKSFDCDIINFDYFIKNFSYEAIDIYIDIKGSDLVIEKIFEYITKNNINISTFYFASFNFNHLQKLQLFKSKSQFNFKIGFITQNSFNVDTLNSIIKDIDFIVYELDYLNHLEIDFLKKNNITVYVHTLKNEIYLKKLQNYNIDGIVSDIFF